MSQTTPATLEDHTEQAAVPIGMLEEGMEDVRARSGPHVEIEYGRRTDDGALVFHLFPPGYAMAQNDERHAALWSNWRGARDAVEEAALKHFTLDRIDAGYAEELASFFVIIHPPPPVPDLMALIERFLLDLEAGLRTASETRP